MKEPLMAFVAFVLVLAPLVFFRERGHFLVAKYFRIGAPVFSIGLGPRLFGWRRGGTDYRVSLVPLGGYVRLAGDESDENRSGAPEEFLTRSRWQRFLVFVAGATFNLVLAVLAGLALRAGDGTSNRPGVGPPCGGTISAATTIAAGAEMIDAARMWPMASGTTGPRMLAYNTITVPATPAMPQVITMNSSPRDSMAR